MSSRPIVGVPADRRVLGPHPFHMVGEKYLNAITDAADALPLIVPALADTIGIDEVLSHCDGILLTGSPSNVDPRHYDGEAAREGTLLDPQRDALTLPLARRAIDAGVPLMALCRGFQELNVVLGGSLHQYVHEVPGYHLHKEDPGDPVELQYGPSHPVTLVDGGLLRQLAGTDTVMVNSLHSQGVRRLANGVTVEAVADDGLVEAFTVDDARAFALAIQWHPEWKVTGNPFSLSIFKAFGSACREHAAGRQV